MSGHLCFQGMVFQFIARGPQPYVLPVPVCKSEQLYSADKPGIIRESGPSALFSVHWAVHRHGNCSTLVFFSLLLIKVEFKFSLSVFITLNGNGVTDSGK